MSRIKFLTHKCISSNLNTIYLNLNTINFPNHGVGGGVWGSFGTFSARGGANDLLGRPEGTGEVGNHQIFLH